jgi:hypothetical protein
MDDVARVATFAINFPLAFAHLAMHFPRVRAGGKWRVRDLSGRQRIAPCRSHQRSSASSMPTLSRSSPGDKCCCPAIAARRSVVESTEPRLAACLINFTLWQTESGTSAPPRKSNESMLPNPLSTRRATS